MLDQLGMTELWTNQDTILTMRLNTIKQRLLDHYYQSWYSNINNSRRQNTYCIFKHTFNLEPYLDIITNKRLRSALRRYRLSSHKLKIEHGRYHNIDRKNSICKYCNLKAIENEYHFYWCVPCTGILENSILLLIIVVGQQSIHLKPFYQNKIKKLP